MNELLEEKQVISIVPQDFTKSNKGVVQNVHSKFFTVKLAHEPVGLEPKKIVELYSQTKNGTLYFNSAIVKVEPDNTLVFAMPMKHRFLQRRAFTRVKFVQDVNLDVDGTKYVAKTVDIAAGGIKFVSKLPIDIDKEYNLEVELVNENCIQCQFNPIKLEKNDDGTYTVAGSFKNLTRAQIMKIFQFCTRKNIENNNR